MKYSAFPHRVFLSSINQQSSEKSWMGVLKPSSKQRTSKKVSGLMHFASLHNDFRITSLNCCTADVNLSISLSLKGLVPSHIYTWCQVGHGGRLPFKCSCLNWQLVGPTLVKSCSSQFFFVQPKIILILPSFFVVYYLIIYFKSLFWSRQFKTNPMFENSENILWVFFPLFSCDYNDRLSLNFLKFVFWVAYNVKRRYWSLT